MRNKKRISILLVMAMVMTLLAGLAAPAAAATTNIALSIPNVTVADNQTLGTIRITDHQHAITPGIEIMLTLPSGVEYVTAPTGVANYVRIPASVGAVANSLAPADVIFVSGTTRTLVVRVDAISNPVMPVGTTSRAPIIEFLFNDPGDSQVDITGVAGDVAVNILETTGVVTSGNVVNARIVTAGTTSAALAAPSLSEGLNRAIGTIRIIENSPGALAIGAASISLTLPDGITWTAPPAINLAGGFAPGEVTAGAVDTDGRGFSRFRLNINDVSNVLPGVIDVTGAVDISPTAVTGDIIVSVGGTNTGITPATLTVARNVVFGTGVSTRATPNIFAGRFDASVGNLVITEQAAGSLVAGRTIRLELPVGATWNVIPVIHRVRGDVGIGAGVIVAGTGNRTITYNVNAASNTASEIEFRLGSVNVLADTAPGDIAVTVSGTAGASGTATLAKIVAPLSAAAATPADVIIGLPGQTAGDFTVTEAGAGVLLANPRGVAGNLEIWCPAGVGFAVTPTVAVTSGNLVIDSANVRRMAEGTRLIIPIRTSSTTASTITISGVRLTLNRTVPEGPVALRVGGSAVDLFGGAGALPPAAGTAALIAAGVAPAIVRTPAPDDRVLTSVFTIGALSFTRAGVTTPMTVAPTIVDGRTMLPLRYVALAVGISEEDIIWDPARRTVTLLRGDRVVQLRIGDRAMTINGVVVPIDVPAAITAGRTVLPIAAVARALRATITWDATARTATVSAE